MSRAESGTHVGEKAVPRATQTIPPARRRIVRSRDHRQCFVEGCKASIFVDVHHLNWDNTDHRLDNMVVCCGAHHRAIHAGKLIVKGTPSTGISFHHADGSPYGSRVIRLE